MNIYFLFPQPLVVLEFHRIQYNEFADQCDSRLCLLLIFEKRKKCQFCNVFVNSKKSDPTSGKHTVIRNYIFIKLNFKFYIFIIFIFVVACPSHFLNVLVFVSVTENATLEIQKQDVDRKMTHSRILKDLNKIRNKAEEVWNKIGEKFSVLLIKII